MRTQSKSKSPVQAILFLLIISMGLVLLTCEDPPPEDPRYSLTEPTLLAVEAISDTEIRLRWKNSEEYAEEIVIFRKTDSLTWESIAEVPVVEVTYIDSGLQIGSTYAYRLQAKVEVNYSEYSNELLDSISFLPPPNFSVDILSDTTTYLSWTDVYTYETGYLLQRNQEDLVLLPPDSTHFLDAGLIFGEFYEYRIATVTDNNQSVWSTLDSLQTVFPQPTEIKVTPKSDAALDISWEDNSIFEAGFIIERNDGAGFNFLANVNADVTEYSDTGLNAGTIYIYRVAAFTDANQSEWLISSSVSTVDLIAPYWLVVDPDQDARIDLSWQDVNVIHIGFVIEREDGNGFVEIARIPASASTYSDTGLTHGLQYQYRVAAFTDQNVSDWATSNEVITDFPRPTYFYITPVNDASMQLEWRDNCSFESGYALERDDGSGFVHIADFVPNTETYTDTALTDGVSYTYRLAAYTPRNISEWVHSSTRQTYFTAPSYFTTFALNDAQISLEWRDNTIFEEGFILERRSDGSDYVQIADLDANQTTFLDTALNYGSTYRYRVSAYTRHNTSQHTISSQTNTVFPHPYYVSGFPINEAKIRLLWTDECEFESGFYVERNDGTGWVAIDTLSQNSTEYIDEDLSEGSRYTYRVAAFTNYNQSAWATSGSILTDSFPPPYSLNVYTVDDATVELSWVDYNDLVVGYLLERDQDGEENWVTIAADLPATASDFTDTGLLHGPTYTYRISSFSTDIYSTLVSSDPIQTVFPRPTGAVVSTIDDHQLQVNWEDHSEFEDGFIIRRATDAEYDSVGSVTQDVEEFVDTGLSYGVEYRYQIVAYTETNESESAISAVASTVFPEPTNLVMEALNDTTIGLSWLDNCEFEDNYIIEVSTGGDFLQVDSIGPNSTAVTIAGLEFGLDYAFRVAAQTQYNTSDYLTSTTIQTLFPDTPTNIDVEALSDAEIWISWVDNCHFESAYRLERNVDGAGFGLLETLLPNTTQFIDSNLVFGSEYSYRVAAVTESNQSSWASSLSLETMAPLAPSDFALAPLSDTEIQLNWLDNSSFEDGYRLERNDGSGWENVVELGVDAIAYRDSGLAFGESYQYRLAAFTTQVQTDWIESLPVATVFPDLPSDLVVTPVSDHELSLVWSDNCEFEAGYIIQRDIDDGAGFVALDTVGSSITEFVDSELQYGDFYYSYRIAAYTLANDTDWLTSNPRATVFPAPTLLTATSISDLELLLTWEDNSSFETGFTIERDAGSGFVALTTTLADVTQFTDSNLDVGETYIYRIAAISDFNSSNWTISSAYSTNLPGPTFLTAQATDDATIELEWDDNYSFETGFHLERDAGSGFIALPDQNAGVTNYTDTGLTFGVEYQYRVSTFTAGNTSTWIESDVLTTQLDGPSDISVEAQDDATIIVTWVDNTTSETDYTLQRSDAGSAFATIASPVANATSFEDTGLSLNTDYQYRVAANTATNTSDWNTSSVISTLNLDLPTSLGGSALSDVSLSITWVDNCDFEGGYLLERNSGAGFVEIADLPANTESHTDNGRTYGVTYYYRIAVYSEDNTSSWVASSGLTTVFAGPSDISVQAQDDATIDIEWIDHSDIETGFTLERSDADGAFVTIASPPANTTTYEDTGLLQGTDYQYRVAANTATNTSDWNTSSVITTLDLDLPTFVMVEALTDASVEITWEDNCAFEDGYILQEDDGSGYVEIDDIAANSTSYTQTGLSVGTEYTYRVIVYTDDNEADPVYSSSVITEFPAPTGLSVIPVSIGEVDLSWIDNSTFESGFKIERKEGANFVQIEEVGANVTSYSNDGLDIERLYSYRVYAFTVDNNSDYSGEALAGTNLIPAGVYNYGEDATLTSDLNLDYLMMHYEVTNAQYLTYLNAARGAGDISVGADAVTGPYAGAGSFEYLDLDDAVGGHIFNAAGDLYVHVGYENHPVTEVTWYGATAFAEHYGLRLPTEKEWEKAARGDFGYDYPWGDEAPTCDQANFSGCEGDTQPVGETTGESPYGVSDMAGNVWEWTATVDGTDRVLRGGSFSNSSTYLQTWVQYSMDPENSNANVGFRCVVDN